MARYGKTGAPSPKLSALQARSGLAVDRALGAVRAAASGKPVNLAPLRQEHDAIQREAEALGLVPEGEPQSAMPDQLKTRSVPTTAPDAHSGFVIGSARTPDGPATGGTPIPSSRNR